MKNYLKIQSEGEIESGAFTLIGASTKRNDSTKIGYYGSGLKYSISALIRNKIAFKVFSGNREIKIDTRTESFRNDSFEMIIVDGQTTSLTTNMGGSDWDRPFAPIREIYSNALDEDENATLSKEQMISGREGKTTFYIEMTDDVGHFYENVNMYFCNQNERVLSSNIYGSIYHTGDDKGIRLFRKNILCYSNPKQRALFNYNSGQYSINESRVISSNWIGEYYTGHIWKGVQDESLINQLLEGMKGGNSGLFEHDIDWDSQAYKFTDEWFNVCSRISFAPAELVMFADDSDLEGRMILPSNLLYALNRQFDGLDILGLSDGLSEAKFIIKQNPSTMILNKVVDAIAILMDSNYKYRMEDGLNIKYVNFKNEDTFGMANKGVIYLSTKLDSWDVNAIAKIIIEENEHNITGFGDKTRQFQNHLFNLLFEELNYKL